MVYQNQCAFFGHHTKEKYARDEFSVEELYKVCERNSSCRWSCSHSHQQCPARLQCHRPTARRCLHRLGVYASVLSVVCVAKDGRVTISVNFRCNLGALELTHDITGGATNCFVNVHSVNGELTPSVLCKLPGLPSEGYITSRESSSSVVIPHPRPVIAILGILISLPPLYLTRFSFISIGAEVKQAFGYH